MDTNICLCYTPQRGLFVRDCPNSSDAIFSAYDYKGYRSTTIEVPLKPIRIKIESNFHYGSKSYLYSCIERNDTPLLDFSLDQIMVLNYCSVERFSVATEDWQGLFSKIIDACNRDNKSQYYLKAIRYIDKLEEFLDADSIEIKSVLHDKQTVMWNDKFSLTLLIAYKLRDLLGGLKNGGIENDILTDKILKVCQLYIKNLKRIDVDPEDSRTIGFAKALTDICNFMVEHDAELDFLMNLCQ